MNPKINNDQHWMRQALALAQRAEALGEVPVGAVVVKDNQIIGEGFNQPISSSDPTAHAEVVALRDAAKNIGNYRLIDCTLYSTIEPCTMCSGAIIHGRVARLVYGATEPKAGAVCSQAQLLDMAHLNHRIVVTPGVLADKCSAVISNFFANRRRK